MVACQAVFSASGMLPRDIDSTFQTGRVVFVHGARQIVTEFSGMNAPQRKELEQFVRRVFEEAYGAQITHFMPQLMSLRGEDGQLLAVCGLRNGKAGKLFLENYMDQPIEAALSERTGSPVLRSEVVEIGNLAVAEPGMARQLLAGVIRHLHGTNAQWAVFTAIPALRNSLAKLNVPLEVLCDAHIGRLDPAEHAAWGNYYDQGPQVMAVRRMPTDLAAFRNLQG